MDCNKCLKLCTWNVNGALSKKRNELSLFLFENDISIVLLTETFLKPHMTFNLPGFSTVRADRVGSSGGGVAILLKNNICFRVLTNTNSIKLPFEHVGIETVLFGVATNIHACYIPPKTTLNKHDMDAWFAPQHVIIGGDLNAKNVIWGSRLRNKNGKTLSMILNLHNIQPWGPKDVTTVPSYGKRGDVIDIFLTKNIAGKKEVYTFQKLHSDHIPVILSLNPNCAGHSAPSPTVKTNWTKYAYFMTGFKFSENITSPEDIDTAAKNLANTITSNLKAAQSQTLCSQANN